MSSHLWVLSLEFANLVAHTQFAFLKYPCLGPPLTPFGEVYILACQQRCSGVVNRVSLGGK